MSNNTDYALGYSDEEFRRLAAQAAFYEDLTEDVLRRAGLRPGMRVLDLGCGVGDVSLLAARLVGTDGTVLGIDRTASGVEVAQRRAKALGVTNVRFDVTELDALDPEQFFDALIGRFVLMYVPDPAGLLHRLSRCLRPGGIVAFQEMDMSHMAVVPASALFDKVSYWMHSAFRAAGAEVDMGSQLLTTFLHAGLPRPTMIAASRVESGPDSPAYEAPAGVLRSLLPVIEQAGIASPTQIDVDTLGNRLRAEVVTGERVVFLPRLVGAWTRLPT